jgi:hypothetical protein
VPLTDPKDDPVILPPFETPVSCGNPVTWEKPVPKLALLAVPPLAWLPPEKIMPAVPVAFGKLVPTPPRLWVSPPVLPGGYRPAVPVPFDRPNSPCALLLAW